MLDLYQQRGYSEVDTARVYVSRKQEAFTREAGWKERGLTLATKVQYPSTPGDNTADKVAESVEISLKELGTDCVDLLYLHAAVCAHSFVVFLQHSIPRVLMVSCGLYGMASLYACNDLLMVRNLLRF